MKKLLLGTAAVALGLALAVPAKAEGVSLDVSGHFKGYGVFGNQDNNYNAGGDASNENARTFDILRETELWFFGETTLDNGMTVGAHFELDVDGTEGGTAIDSIETDESYVYFSGSWGRVNFGREDGAAYLMQIAAPSADSNVDGLRQYVQPVNMQALTGNAIGAGNFAFDYDNNLSTKDNKFTYMTPMFNGFQVGASYTPDLGQTTSRGLDGVNLSDQDGTFGDVYELAARWEGNLGDLGVNLGGGWSQANKEDDITAAAGVVSDDRKQWNVGLDMDWGPFGVGVVYKEDDFGDTFLTNSAVLKTDEEDIIVVGIDYTTGPFKLGASYYDANNFAGQNNLDATRWAGGVTYTYGPGMTFRGSVQFLNMDDMSDATGLAAGATLNSENATSILLGTQVNF